MLNIILRDVPEVRDNLLPLTFTRSVADLRLGILTLRQKWELSLPAVYSYMTADYLSVKYPSISSPDDDSFIVSAHFFPTPGVVKGVEHLRKGQALMFHDEEIARRCPLDQQPDELIQLDEIPLRLTRPYDIFQLNAAALEYDFTLLTAGRESVAPSPSNTIIGDPSRLFIEPGATMEGAIVNLNHGPVYLAAGSEVMEGTCIRGGLALCEGAQIKMGSRIYGATTIGPHSKVGGEVANIVIIGYSNKAHDGFLGNAVIGEWCNIAAGCAASNLKNDYTEIKDRSQHNDQHRYGVRSRSQLPRLGIPAQLRPVIYRRIHRRDDRSAVRQIHRHRAPRHGAPRCQPHSGRRRHLPPSLRSHRHISLTRTAVPSEIYLRTTTALGHPFL